MEKDVVLKFATDVKALLEASGKVEVVMTRDDDSFVALGERVRFARDRRANLFVSIHADSVKQDFVRGATVYTNAERATDADAAALALKENAADQVAGLEDDAEKDEIMTILADLTRRETKTVLARRRRHLRARALLGDADDPQSASGRELHRAACSRRSVGAGRDRLSFATPTTRSC